MSGPIPIEGSALFKHPIAAAAMAVLHEKGFEATSVEKICARAGVPRDDLPQPFQMKVLLALAVSEAYVEDFRDRVGGAFEGEEMWPDTLRAAAYETLRWVGHHPDAAWWGTVGVLEVGEVARARRDGVFAWTAGLIEAGREVSPDPEAVPAGAALHAVGAVVEALGRKVQGRIPDDPVEAVPLMMYAAVRPYLGEEAARAELTIEPPADLQDATVLVAIPPRD
jgi:AcrR family transcriptional regulator